MRNLNFIDRWWWVCVLLATALLAGACSGNPLTPEPPSPPPPFQEGCQFTVTPEQSNLTVDADGAVIRQEVATSTGCNWFAESKTNFITISEGGRGSGSGTVQLTVTPNTGAARTGTVVTATKTFTVAQAAAACRLTLSGDTNRTFGASGDSGSITVTMTQGDECSWTAASDAAFITLTSPASGTGSGTTTFNVARNSGNARTGTLTVAGQRVTVRQDGVGEPPASSCTYSISGDTNRTFPASGGAGSVGVAVTQGVSCSWSSVSASPFIVMTSGTSGTGSQTVTFAVAPNTGGARTGTLTIAGQTVTVSQEGGVPTPSELCRTLTLDPPNPQIPAGTGDGTVVVTTQAGCVWTVHSNDGWLKITSATTGTGAGRVDWTAAVNRGPARSGTLTFRAATLTQIITVSQAKDTTGPVITVLGDLVVKTTSWGGANVTYQASATDDVDGRVPVTCAPPSGALFPLGTTGVMCSAADLSSNKSEGPFKVTVLIGCKEKALRIAGIEGEIELLQIELRSAATFEKPGLLLQIRFLQDELGTLRGQLCL
jgi:hypothetical protein